MQESVAYARLIPLLSVRFGCLSIGKGGLSLPVDGKEAIGRQYLEIPHCWRWASFPMFYAYNRLKHTLSQLWHVSKKCACS